MNYEERYYELLEAMDRAKDRLAITPYSIPKQSEYTQARIEFTEYCAVVLEKLMEKDAEILARLK